MIVKVPVVQDRKEETKEMVKKVRHNLYLLDQGTSLFLVLNNVDHLPCIKIMTS